RRRFGHHGLLFSFEVPFSWTTCHAEAVNVSRVQSYRHKESSLMRHCDGARQSRRTNSLRSAWSIAPFVLLSIASLRLLAESPDTEPKTNQRTADPNRSAKSAIEGKWTYRSFRSDPDLNTEPNKLLFDSGTMNLSQPAPDRLAGTLGGDGWQL